MSTLYQLFQQQAEKLGDAPAVQALNAANLSYRGIVAQIEHVTWALAGWSIGRGDRVMIQLPNGAEPFLAFHAVGAIAVALLVDPRAGAAEIDGFMTFVEPKAMIVQQGVAGSGRELAEKYGVRVIDIVPTPEKGAGTFVFAEPPAAPREPVSLNGPDDLSYLIQTSGTTALPKLVAQTQTTMLNNVLQPLQNRALLLGESGPIRLMNYAPMQLSAGILNSSAPMASGGSVACMSSFDLARIFDWFDTFQPDTLSASPALLEQVVAAARTKDRHLWRSLRSIFTGSAPLTQALADELRDVFALPVAHVYGMTEVGTIAQVLLRLGEVLPAGMVGRPVRPEHVRIAGDEGDFLPANQAGEVVVRSELFIGYWNNSEANEAASLDGWFRTGDLGYLDENGFLFLTGRIKEVINSGGAKVSPNEVEAVLMQHPQVKAAAVFGLKNAEVGETVAAAVVGDVSERELRKFASERLPFFKVPTRIVIVEALPTAPSGKVPRNRLPELLGLL